MMDLSKNITKEQMLNIVGILLGLLGSNLMVIIFMANILNDVSLSHTLIISIFSFSIVLIIIGIIISNLVFKGCIMIYSSLNFIVVMAIDHSISRIQQSFFSHSLNLIAIVIFLIGTVILYLTVKEC